MLGKRVGGARRWGAGSGLTYREGEPGRRGQTPQSSRTWTPESPRPRGRREKNSLHPTGCPEVWGPGSAAWRVLGKGGGENGGGAIGRATRGKKGPGGSLVTEAGPSCLQPQPLPARPGQASSCWKSFQPQRSEVCSPSPGTKLHPARPAGSHPWGLRPCSPGQTAPRGREGWTNIREWGLEGNIWVSQGMH